MSEYKIQRSYETVGSTPGLREAISGEPTYIIETEIDGGAGKIIGEGYHITTPGLKIEVEDGIVLETPFTYWIESGHYSNPPAYLMPGLVSREDMEHDFKLALSEYGETGD